MRWLRWFDPRMWQWAFKNSTGLRNAVCRMRGHPAGVWWFNPLGSSPDMHCKNCDEDLG